jgi:hypothetical protein
MSNAQSGFEKLTWVRAPADELPDNGCHACVPKRRIESEVMLVPVALTRLNPEAPPAKAGVNPRDKLAAASAKVSLRTA